jgi:hypothetical protein
VREFRRVVHGERKKLIQTCPLVEPRQRPLFQDGSQIFRQPSQIARCVHRPPGVLASRQEVPDALGVDPLLGGDLRQSEPEVDRELHVVTAAELTRLEIHDLPAALVFSPERVPSLLEATLAEPRRDLLADIASYCSRTVIAVIVTIACEAGRVVWARSRFVADPVRRRASPVGRSAGCCGGAAMDCFHMRFHGAGNGAGPFWQERLGA